MSITVQGPDGKIIEFPDGTPSATIQKAMAQQYPAPKPPAKPPEPSWWDVTKSAVEHIPSSAANFVGGVGHAVMHPLETVGNAIDLGAGELAKVTPKPIYNAMEKADWNKAATARAEKTATSTNEFYKQRYGSVAGVKNALATDPVGVAADASTVLGGGSAIAKVGRLGKTAKALDTASTLTNPSNAMLAAAKPVLKAIPKAGGPVKTLAQLKTEASNAYAAADAAGVQVSPDAMTGLSQRAHQLAAQLKYDPDTDPVTAKALDLIDKKAGKPMSLGSLEKFRRAIRDLPYTRIGNDAARADEQMMVGKLEDLVDNFMLNLAPGDVTSGNGQQGTTALTKARGLAQQGYKAETVDNAIQLAADKAKQRNLATTYGDALRSEFARIVNNPNKMRRFTPDEQKAITEIANGTPSRRTLQMFAKLAPSSGRLLPLEGAGAYGAAVTGHPLIGAGLLGTTGFAYGAKAAANKMTSNAAERARNAMLGNKTVPRTIPPVVKKAAKVVTPATRINQAQGG